MSATLIEARESLVAFCEWAGIPLLDWQREAFGAATERLGGRFRFRLAGLSISRGNGKTWAAAIVGLWRLVCGRPGTVIVSSALDSDGARLTLKHARRIIAASPKLEELGIEIFQSELRIARTGSYWRVVSRDHQSSRGIHADVLLMDEVGWLKDDELFSSLLAGQAPCPDPLAIVVSTVGRRQNGPLWQTKVLAESGDAKTFWWYYAGNLSPHVTTEYLEAQRKTLMPAAYAREHGNAWVDAQDGFTTQAEVDDAMSTGQPDETAGRRDVQSVVFVDLGAVHDPSVIALGYLLEGRVKIARLITFQGTRAKPVQLEAVEDELKRLAGEWSIKRIRVESWQGIGTVQRLSRIGLPVELFSPTAKAHSEEWPALAARLASRTIDLPKHAKLREELLSLVYEVTPTGVKVIDRGKVHQDHAVAVRGVAAMLNQRTSSGFGVYVDGRPIRRDVVGGCHVVGGNR